MVVTVNVLKPLAICRLCDHGTGLYLYHSGLGVLIMAFAVCGDDHDSFALIGAVVGHYVMGLTMTILSMFALIALRELW